MRGKRDMRFCGLSFRSVTNVSFPSLLGILKIHFIDSSWIGVQTRGDLSILVDITLTVEILNEGSRYIYDLYYEKQAISKQLYDWLLKNNYADANLIAKWKKQGYEKVHASFSPVPFPAFLRTDDHS